MATIIGSNVAYNYHGVTGSDYGLEKGEQILVTWINESKSNLNLIPTLSLRSPLRFDVSKLYEWHKLDKLRFDVTEEVAGLINV